jgi:hypothetical protein
MLTKSRITFATALAVAAIGTSPALAIADWNVQGSPPNDGRENPTSPIGAGSESSTPDARGEYSASLSESAPATAPDLRTADAQEPFVRPVVVEIGDPAPGGFDWPAAIIGLAGGLGLNVVAEGVGTRAQLDFLARRCCHAFQGFWVSEPLPAEAFRPFVIGRAALVPETKFGT